MAHSPQVRHAQFRGWSTTKKASDQCTQANELAAEADAGGSIHVRLRTRFVSSEWPRPCPSYSAERVVRRDCNIVSQLCLIDRLHLHRENVEGARMSRYLGRHSNAERLVIALVAIGPFMQVSPARFLVK